MLTRFALANPMLLLALVLLAIVAGPLSFLTHPSREDPKITIRTAQVQARFAGMPADKVEQLITLPLEEKARELPEVDEIASTTSVGQALLSITVADQYTDLEPIWTSLRDKMDEVAGSLPEGTEGPFVDTDQGDVAMATLVLTGEGFDNAELHAVARRLRRALYAEVNGVRRITFFGVREQRVYVEFDTVRLAQLGLDPDAIVGSIQSQNVIRPGGQIQAEGWTVAVQPSGDFSDLAEIRDLPIALPESDGGALYLSDIANISLAYRDPPGSEAYFNGAPAIVIGVSMIDGFDAGAFASSLQGFLAKARVDVPIGVSIDVVTYQPEEIETAVFGVVNNLWQTILVVLAVVIGFLGLRAGLLVGAMVPLVMIATILIMRMLGIELERMSLASLIISLGLLVDNGIVVVEELQGRLARGESRKAAAKAVGQELSMPLLAASLTTIFAFVPLMLMPGSAGEYTRSISFVVAIALLASWVIALTALILLASITLRRGEPVDEESAYDRSYYRVFRRWMSAAVRWRWPATAGSFATIVIGVFLFSSVSKTFFPNS